MMKLMICQEIHLSFKNVKKIQKFTVCNLSYTRMLLVAEYLWVWVLV